MNLSAILALGSPPQPGQPQSPAWLQLGLFVPMIVIFYFLLIRPQQKKARQQADLIKAIKAGDRVVTTSGILATVITVKEKSLSIRSADSKMEITKSAVAEILERNGDSSES